MIPKRHLRASAPILAFMLTTIMPASLKASDQTDRMRECEKEMYWTGTISKDCRKLYQNIQLDTRPVTPPPPPLITDAQENGKVYCLNETELPDGSLYFWDATDGLKALSFKDRDEQEYMTGKYNYLASYHSKITVSNAAVIVFKNLEAQWRLGTRDRDAAWEVGPMNPSPPPGEEYSPFYRKGAKWALASVLDSWVDPLGFVHSVSVIKRQLRFNDWVVQSGSRDIKQLAVTGLIDRPTLLSESVKLRYLLDRTKSRIRKACADATANQSTCDAPPWPNDQIRSAEDALMESVQALARYDAALSYVRFGPPASRPAACDYSPELITHPDFSKDSDGVYDKRYVDVVLVQGVVPYATEALDVQSFNAGFAGNLSDLEAAARSSIQKAILAAAEDE
jgi:hypothetical protein